jgi:hypothetical protein
VFRKLGITFTAIVLAALPLQGPVQAEFELTLFNPSVAVFSAALPAHARGTLFQNTRDVILIGLSGPELTLFRSAGEHETFSASAGNVRLLPRNAVKSIANETGEAPRVVIVQLKSAVGATCGCSSEIEQAICGCSSRRLPGLWAFAAGSVTLAGTSLTAAQPFWGSAPRGNTLLVGSHRCDCRRQAAPGPTLA